MNINISTKNPYSKILFAKALSLVTAVIITQECLAKTLCHQVHETPQEVISQELPAEESAAGDLGSERRSRTTFPLSLWINGFGGGGSAAVLMRKPASSDHFPHGWRVVTYKPRRSDVPAYPIAIFLHFQTFKRLGNSDAVMDYIQTAIGEAAFVRREEVGNQLQEIFATGVDSFLSSSEILISFNPFGPARSFMDEKLKAGRVIALRPLPKMKANPSIGMVFIPLVKSKDSQSLRTP